MALNIKRPNGTEDVLPKDVYKWHTVEKIARETAESFGFGELRFPSFENTELFLRSVGETTDVVQKEMYTVKAKETEFTLRPEGTACAIRAMLQNGLLNEALPQRIYYIISCFRHERPQAGRLREFHQFGVEMAGSAAPTADAEVILLAKTLLERLGLKNIKLLINSIGCPTCRAKYHEALKAYFEPHIDELCDTCKERLVKNPMRLLDCKSPICKEIGKDAPVITDYLCEDCSDHFAKLQKYLTGFGIEYTVDPRIVRGLDYYTKTVFEFVTTEIGAQGTVCGGGRYDGLIEELGGQKTPSLGFGLGLERLMLLMEAQSCEFPEDARPDLFIAALGEKATLKAIDIAKDMRAEGYSCLYDLNSRSLRAQMKYADKLNAKYTIVIGDSEVEEGVAKLKDMQTGEETEIALATFVSGYYSITLASQLDDLKINGEEFDFNSLFGLDKKDE